MNRRLSGVMRAIQCDVGLLACDMEEMERQLDEAKKERDDAIARLAEVRDRILAIQKESYDGSISSKNCLWCAEVNEIATTILRQTPPAEKVIKPSNPWAAFPPPPGEEWHNPDGLTPDQVGVRDGWRLLLKSEVLKNGPKWSTSICAWLRTCERWYDNGGAGHVGDCVTVTYRTSAKLPVKQPDAPKREVFELPRDITTDMSLECAVTDLLQNQISLRNHIREIEAAQADIVARLERGGL